ncbi:MAG: polysaccharide biosynthesis tyrosine autokinase [Desulfomonilaceae bacterium]|nr:polysaccharide biosynthesis tyrosine autokinase [Desulfomonilaceae bacterium]
MSDFDRKRQLQPYAGRDVPENRQAGFVGVPPARDRLAPPPLDDPLNDNVQSLRDYLEIALRYKWLVLAVFACTFLASILYAFTKTPIFTASATLVVEQQHAGPTKESVYGNQAFTDYMAYFLTQKEILTSRHLAEAVAERMDLASRPEFNSDSPSLTGLLRQTLSRWVLPLSAQKVDAEAADADLARKNALRNAVLARVSVQPVKKSNLMAVMVEDADPKLAQEMLGTLLDLYVEQNLETRKKKSLEAAGWLKKEVIESEKKQREAQVKLVEFTIDHGIVDSADGGLTQVLSLVNRTMEGRVKSHETRAKIQALRNEGSSEKGSLLPEGMKDEYIGKLKQELAMMESEYSQQKGVYAADYPKMKMLAKKIGFLRDRVAQIEDDLVASALGSAETAEKLLEESYASARAEADRVKSLEAQYTLLRKDVDTNSEFHKILLEEYKRTEIRARTISNNVRVVDPPNRPLYPSKPKKQLIVLIGAMLGLMGGLGAAFVLSSLDQRIHSPLEIEQRLQVNRLGIVPDVNTLPAAMGGRNGNAAVDFVAYRHPKSPMSDAIRNLETSIFLSNVDRDVHSIAVSSAAPGEGKTTVAISLATVLSSDPKKKIVIVDADLRKPRLHRAFGLSERSSGLVNLLEGKVTNLAKVCHRTSIPRVFCVTSGPIPRDPVALLKSGKIQRIAALLKDHFSYVIFDTAPIVGFADTPLIYRVVDGLIMVARQGQARRDELKEALQVVRSMDENKLLGVVMNKVSAGWGYGYGYRYGGNYYYRNYKYYSG